MLNIRICDDPKSPAPVILNFLNFFAGVPTLTAQFSLREIQASGKKNRHDLRFSRHEVLRAFSRPDVSHTTIAYHSLRSLLVLVRSHVIRMTMSLRTAGNYADFSTESLC